MAESWSKYLTAVEKWMRETERSATHSVKWFLGGIQILRRNLGESAGYVNQAAAGHSITLRERHMISKTVYDCLKLIPLTVIAMAPFGSIMLPLVMHKCSPMLPSTFFKPQLDDVTLARQLEERYRLVQAWHHEIVPRQTMVQPTVCDLDSHLYRPLKLRLMVFPTTEEILDFQGGSGKSVQLQHMTLLQLCSMARALGIKPTKMSWFLEAQIRHHMKRIRNEDVHLKWEGVYTLSRIELITACRLRGIPFYGLPRSEMLKYLNRWLQLSSNKDILMSVLFWVQSLHFRSALVKQPVEDADMALALQRRRQQMANHKLMCSFTEEPQSCLRSAQK